MSISNQITIPGVFINVYNVGVLLVGESGIGKSEVALSLVCRNHQLVSDDAITIHKDNNGELIGTCPPELQDFIEIRGLGIMNLRVLYGEQAVCSSSKLELIIKLEDMQKISISAEQRLTGTTETIKVLDTEIPQYTIPVAPDRNFDILIETAVKKHKLQKRGYNAFDEYKEHLRLTQEKVEAL